MNSKVVKRSTPRTGDFTPSPTPNVTMAEVKHRPSSAPAATTQDNVNIALVEQRLRIVKRNRSKGDDGTGISGTVPPVGHFPVFDVNRPSKPDQQALEVVVREVLNCLLFSDAPMF